MGQSRIADVAGDHLAFAVIDAVGAGSATIDQVIFTAPFKCQVTSISISPDVATTGANTNTRHLNVIDKGSDGSGATEIGNLDLTLGVDLTAFADNVIAQGLANAMSIGDVLTLQGELIGTGGAVAISRAQIAITYQPL